MRRRSVIAMRLISAVMQSILPPSMRSQNRFAPCTWTTPLAWSLVLVAVSGCKPDASQAPRADLDNIAAIESELAANASRLQAQGVHVAPVNQEGADRAAAPDDVDAEAGAPEPTVEPAPEPEPPPAAAPVEMDEAMEEPELGIARRDRPKRSERRAKKSRDRAPTRCERICDLADSTCDLAGRICALAEEHLDDVRYEEACDNAEAQCEAASEACETCED